MNFEAENTTDAQLAKAVKTQMEGFDIQKDFDVWSKAERPRNAYSWISWLEPNGGVPGDCTPPAPWTKGQSVSCRFYGQGNLVRKAGYELDFRITPAGVVSDVKLYKLATLLGIAKLQAIH